MRVVLSQKRAQNHFAPMARAANGSAFVASKPARKRKLDLRLHLKAFNALHSIWRWTHGRFSRQPQWHAFVDWQAYYSACLHPDASHGLVEHGGPYVGDFARQMQLVEEVIAGREPTIVSAPPGCGKSRFALELARQVEQTHPRWQVVFVRHDEKVVRQELPDLVDSKRTIFIVDDAHECPELVELLATACARSTATAPPHLICLTRSTARARVSRAINNALPHGMIRQIDLGRPPLKLVRTLIDQLLPESSPHHRDTIARFVRQSYFGAVLVCSMLRRETRLPQTFQRHDLRDRICRESLRGAADGLCPIEAALRALAVYAALGPVPKASADACEWAAELSGLAPATVNTLTDRVLEARLFQQDPLALMRPTPDLRGDLILEQACLDAHGKPTPFSTELLQLLLEAEPVATAGNCANIGQLFGTTQDVDIVSSFALERARTIPVGKPADALELLRSTQPLAACRPATVVELVRILETREILRRKPPAAELIGSESVEITACSLLMSAGEVDSTAVPVALALGRDLHVASGDVARSRAYVLEQLKAYCKFEKGRTLAHAQAVVDTLRAWVSDSDAESAALAASLNARFLTLELEGQQVQAVRDIVIDTLTRAMAHGDPTVQRAAIESLERYADRQGTVDQTWPDGSLPQLTRETEQLSAALVKLVKGSGSLPVSAAAELQGWSWWAQQPEALHRAGVAILGAIPSCDAYRLWKLLYAPRLPLRTALPEATPAGAEDRQQYVLTLATARAADTVEQARQLFDTLDLRTPDIGPWRALWLAVLEQSPRIPTPHHVGAVVAEFVRCYPEVAWSFVNQADAEGPLFAVLPFLLMELGKLDRARRSTEARGVPAATRLEEAWLLALSSTSDFDEPERAILARGLESTDSDTVHRAAEALLGADSANRSSAFRKVFGVIAHRPTDSELWDLAIERFVTWAEAVLPPRSGKATDEMAQAADELITLLQTYGSQLRWGFQRHTRQLANALAIVAVLRPRRVQDWMQRAWGQAEAAGGGWSDESPLTVGRLSEVMRLIAESPASAQWIDTFLDWMKRNVQLGGVGALGLAELCSLDDIRVGELAQAIRAQPTDASQNALAEFVSHRKKRERPRSGVGATD